MFRASREWLGLSQNQVANLTAESGIPVSRSALCDIERDRNMPGIESLVSLCEVLLLDPREILERIVSPMDLVGDVAGSSVPELRRRVSLLYWNGQFRATVAVCAALLARIPLERSLEPTERQKLSMRMELSRGSALKRCGRYQAAEGALKRSLHFAANRTDSQSESLLALSRLHMDQAVFLLARAESDLAVRLAEVEGSPQILAFAWSVRAEYLYYTVQYEEAAEAFRRARELAMQAGDKRIEAAAEGALASCLFELGHPATALKLYASSVKLCREGRDRNGEASCQFERGRVALHIDARDDAERFAAAGLSIARTSDSPFNMFRGTWLQHQIARRRNSIKPDRQRVAFLRRLYPRVAGNKSMDVINEFRREVLGTANA